MESMREVNRVMEREIKKGSTPLAFEQLGFGDYSYNEITSREKLEQVLSYLLRIGDYKQYVEKTIMNNVYMDLKGKKAVFKRTRLAYERNNIFVAIKRFAKKCKPDFEGKVYLETVQKHMDMENDKVSYYVIADLSTWAENSPERSELERFDSFSEALKKFKAYREKDAQFSDMIMILTNTVIRWMTGMHR